MTASLPEQPSDPSPAAKAGRRALLAHIAAALALLPAIAHANDPAAPAEAVNPEHPNGNPLAGGATLLVAGPDGGEVDRWARTLLPFLARALPPGAAVRKIVSGAADGVTGANRFDVRTVPDGTTLLIAPGTAALAWLNGDPRVHFDVAHWVPVLAGTSPGIVAGRVQLGSLQPGAPLRIAAISPGGADMAALLALELLGFEPVAVFGLETADAGLDAFRQQAVDLVFLHGERVPAQVAAARALGAVPLFSLGTLDATGARIREPQFPDLPHLVEVCASLRGAPPAGPLYAAWRAAAAAAQADFGVLLPQLSPATLIALWRRTAVQAVATPELQSAAGKEGVTLIAGPLAAAGTAAIAVDANTLIELRRWLQRRFNWHPT
jgi:hypothetical protein